MQRVKMRVLQENRINQETFGKSQNMCPLYGFYKIKWFYFFLEILILVLSLLLLLLFFPPHSYLIVRILSFRFLVWIGPIYVKKVDNSHLFSLLLSIIIGLLGKLAFSRNFVKGSKDFIRKDLDPAQLSVLKGALPTLLQWMCYWSSHKRKAWT